MNEPVVISETLPGWVWCAVADAGELRRRIEDALSHFEIGRATAEEALPVDWEHVARQMADALEGREEEPFPSEGS